MARGARASTSEPLGKIPFRFTGKELDTETGLYYYGARYLNPRTSRWISADPGLEDYLPVAPVDEEARRRNQNLPGQGGVFDPINLVLYHYAKNNPLRYRDPMGMDSEEYTIQYYEQGEEPITISEGGQTQTIGQDIDFGETISPEAEINVPEGASLEIANIAERFIISAGGKFTISGIKAKYAEYLASEKYKQAIAQQRARGWVNLTVGIVEVGVGMTVAAKATLVAKLLGVSARTAGALGGGWIWLGLQTAGFGMQDLSAASTGQLLDNTPALKVFRPITYIDW